MIRSDTVTITQQDTVADAEDRFHRFGLISWWDQQRLSNARVLVIGAGALGNEIIKNLALLGIGNIFIADLDRIENSNLSRSVLYRRKHNGRSKAEVAARSAKEIYPDLKVHYFDGNIVYDLGMGIYRWADVVIAGLDNREARLAINRACYKVGRPWIDGAIEQIHGMARVFVPDGPCYECTMSDTDWKLLQNRRSCNLLSKEEMEAAKTPTTPTISSIIAGVQCQEAVKLLHGMDVISGGGWVFNGLSNDAYQTSYQRKEDCYSHDALDQILCLDAEATWLSVDELMAIARDELGPAVELELGRDVLEKLVCPGCGFEEELFMSLGRVEDGKAKCPRCGAARREVVTFHKIRGDEPFMNLTLADLGVPPFDIITARSGSLAIGIELAGDAAQVLGPLPVRVERGAA